MSARTTLLWFGVVGVGLTLGVVCAQWPTVGLLGVGIVVLALVPASIYLLRVSVPVAAAWGLILVHLLNEIRTSWLDELVASAFDLLRVPALLVLFLLVVGQGLPRLFEGPRKTPFMLLLVYCGYLALAGQWGLNPGNSTFYSFWLGGIVLVLSSIVALSPSPERLWQIWLQGLVAVGLLLVVLSLAAIASGTELARSDRFVAGAMQAGYRGIFYNPNVLGGVSSTGAVAALGLTFLRGDQGRPIWLIPVLLLFGVTAVASLSRAALLGYVAGLIVYGVLTPGSRRGWLRGAATAGVVLVLLGAILLRSDAGVAVRTRLADTVVGGGSEDSDGRVTIWRAYLRYGVQHPLVGSGFSNSPMGEDIVAMRLSGRARSEHSAALMYMVSPGLPAGAVLLVVVVLAGIRLRAARTTPLGRSALVYLAGLAPVYLFAAATSPAGWAPYLLWFPLIFLAMLPEQGLGEPRLQPAIPRLDPAETT